MFVPQSPEDNTRVKMFSLFVHSQAFRYFLLFPCHLHRAITVARMACCVYIVLFSVFSLAWGLCTRLYVWRRVYTVGTTATRE